MIKASHINPKQLIIFQKSISKALNVIKNPFEAFFVLKKAKATTELKQK